MEFRSHTMPMAVMMAAACLIVLDLLMRTASGMHCELTWSWRILGRAAAKAAVLVGADPVAGGVALLAEGVLGVLYPNASTIRCA